MSNCIPTSEAGVSAGIMLYMRLQSSLALSLPAVAQSRAFEPASRPPASSFDCGTSSATLPRPVLSGSSTRSSLEYVALHEPSSPLSLKLVMNVRKSLKYAGLTAVPLAPSLVIEPASVTPSGITKA